MFRKGRRPARPAFAYSRWDGTQTGFDFGADELMSELTDDLLYHGDLNAALRRLMQQGVTDQDGERLQGLREIMDKLRQQRREKLDQYDLGGVYDDIAEEKNLAESNPENLRAMSDLLEQWESEMSKTAAPFAPALPKKKYSTNLEKHEEHDPSLSTCRSFRQFVRIPIIWPPNTQRE